MHKNTATKVALVAHTYSSSIPMKFAEHYAEQWDGVTPEQIIILKYGADPDTYFQTWDDVYNRATYTDEHGHTWKLHKDLHLCRVRVD